MLLRASNNVCVNTFKLIEEVGGIDFTINLLLELKSPNQK